ncbi:MAG: hypothetical protein GF353_28330 [Candidatus Lokiarchaeota archaeon]|nr:hypothetical protein [Candidatus Lokiarchaeota archaeon]
MIKVNDRLFVGSESDCRNGNDEWAVVHACKHPCHQGAVGYRGSLESTHPNYLVLENADDLFLNMVDPPAPLFKADSFSSFLEFAGSQWDKGKKILVHCNQGESRAPSLAMMLLAKHVRQISKESYADARNDFLKLYPWYRPGKGIQTFLSQNWQMF